MPRVFTLSLRYLQPWRSERCHLPALVLALLVIATSCSAIQDAVGSVGDESEEAHNLGSEEAEANNSSDEPVQGSGPQSGSAGSGQGTDLTTDASSGPRMVEGVMTDVEFVPAPCEFQVRDLDNPRCGSVSVPADWAAGGDTITLSVAVFPALVDDPAPDPIVFLDGGPGSHTLETARFTGSSMIDPLASRGDVVLFDQRGAGLSEPRLWCPETTELGREEEDTQFVDPVESDDRYFESLAQCSARLQADGIDLGNFNSVLNAFDVEAIRVALGYEQWNLYGISYGTRLGLEVLRQHPDGVRTAVLDSVLPPQVDSVSDNTGSFLASYEAIVAACAAEPLCKAEGDLAANARQVIAELQENPIRIEIDDLLTGESDEVWADGYTVVGVINQAFYNPTWFVDLPELVAELEAGETAALETYLSRMRSNESFFSDGMFHSFDCNDEVAFAGPVTFDDLPPDPFGLQDTFSYASNVGPNAFRSCENWGTEAGPPLSNEPVESDVPTLLMTGRYDPVTPVEWAELAAETLSDSWVVVAPHGSHGVSLDTCGIDIVLLFFDTPELEPDGSCLAENKFSFLGPSGDPELVALTVGDLDPSVPLSGVRPQGWRSGGIGDFYRQASILDPTIVIETIGPETRIDLIEEFLAGEHDLQLSPPTDFAGPDGNTWDYSRATSETASIDWFERDTDEGTVVVALVATPGEREDLVQTVLFPMINGLQIGG